jgi:hypothetical protein
LVEEFLVRLPAVFLPSEHVHFWKFSGKPWMWSVADKAVRHERRDWPSENEE